MDIQKEREALIAEIERFKEEAMKSYVVSCWAESYTNTDPFGYVILENENNKVWWLKTQAYQLWEMWQAAKAHEAKNLEGCVVVQPQGIILTCEEILEVLEFGAPDLKIKRTEYSEEQMSTEITIVHRETGHSGAGIYAYCTECPEEGAIKLGDVEAAKADTEGN